MQARKTRATLCLSFDNMGQARAISAGTASKPDPQEPGLAVGYPRILDLLDELKIRATFFIEAWNCLHHPDRVLEVARRGHDIGLHGFVHEDFAALPQLRAEQVIYDSAAAFGRLGLKPVGFRAPGGARGAFAVAPLSELSLIYDSSLQDGDRRNAPVDEIAQPCFLTPDLISLPFRWRSVDGYIYRTDSGPRTPEHLLETWRRALDARIADGGFMTVIFHAYISGTRDDRFDAMRRFLEYAVGHPDVEVSSLDAAANRLRAARPAQR